MREELDIFRAISADSVDRVKQCMCGNFYNAEGKADAADIKGKNFFTALQYAVLREQPTIVSTLLGSPHVDVNKVIPKNNTTPLLLACQNLSSENNVCKYENIAIDLVRHGANLEAEDSKTGWRAIHYAVKHGKYVLLANLLQSGAKIQRRFLGETRGFKDGFGEEALNALVEENAESSREDFNKTASLFFEFKKETRPLDWAKEKGDVFLQESLLKTALKLPQSKNIFSSWFGRFMNWRNGTAEHLLLMQKTITEVGPFKNILSDEREENNENNSNLDRRVTRASARNANGNILRYDMRMTKNLAENFFHNAKSNNWVSAEFKNIFVGCKSKNEKLAILEKLFKGVAHSKLKSVCFEGNDLDNQCVRGFVKALKVVTNNTLCGVSFKRNKIDDRGAFDLIDGLNKHTQVTDLDLSQNQIKTISELNFNPAEALKTANKLKNLNFAGNEIGIHGAECFAETLGVNGGIHKLLLDGNPLSLVGYSKLAKRIFNAKWVEEEGLQAPIVDVPLSKEAANCRNKRELEAKQKAKIRSLIGVRNRLSKEAFNSFIAEATNIAAAINGESVVVNNEEVNMRSSNVSNQNEAPKTLVVDQGVQTDKTLDDYVAESVKEENLREEVAFCTNLAENSLKALQACQHGACSYDYIVRMFQSLAERGPVGYRRLTFVAGALEKFGGGEGSILIGLIGEAKRRDLIERQAQEKGAQTTSQSGSQSISQVAPTVTPQFRQAAAAPSTPSSENVVAPETEETQKETPRRSKRKRRA